MNLFDGRAMYSAHFQSSIEEWMVLLISVIRRSGLHMPVPSTVKASQTAVTGVCDKRYREAGLAVALG